ncbi:MAG: class II aldolase/adducin family protein [Nitrososphaerota archaeon]|nr:class II aldolase/adducin family protein [Nitrososphaerota archaeon]MDG7024886.1 class II aldolase/adducin family protein [Nitrososphaerota archaeon]
MVKIQRLKGELARTIRRLYDGGLVSGVGGNASVILPSRKEILITPAGYFKGGVAEGDIVRVSIEGKLVGKGKPSSELATHLTAYRLRSDVNAIVHGHPPTAVALITAGISIPSMTPEHAIMIKNLEVFDFAVPGEAGAKTVKESLKRCDVVGIRNHGFFSLGEDLHTAASRLEVLEESARIYLAGRQVGGVPGLQEEDLRRVRAAYSHE